MNCLMIAEEPLPIDQVFAQAPVIIAGVITTHA